MTQDIVERLEDLQAQAITEKSHFYVGRLAIEAAAEIIALRKALSLSLELQMQVATLLKGRPHARSQG